MGLEEAVAVVLYLSLVLELLEGESQRLLESRLTESALNGSLIVVDAFAGSTVKHLEDVCTGVTLHDVLAELALLCANDGTAKC